MTPVDYPPFIEALTQLADALGSKAPTQAGMAVWIQTLKEFPFHEIRATLDIWAKKSTKFPAPAQIFEPLFASRADRIEQKAKIDLIHERKDAEAAFRRSDKLGAMLRALAKRISTDPDRDPKEWAAVIWERFIADRPNPPRGHPGPHEQRIVRWQNEEHAARADDINGEAISHVQLLFAASALRRTVEEAYGERDQRRLEAM